MIELVAIWEAGFDGVYVILASDIIGIVVGAIDELSLCDIDGDTLCKTLLRCFYLDFFDVLQPRFSALRKAKRDSTSLNLEKCFALTEHCFAQLKQGFAQLEQGLAQSQQSLAIFCDALFCNSEQGFA